MPKKHKTAPLSDADYHIGIWLQGVSNSENTAAAYRRDVGEFLAAVKKPFDAVTIADLILYRSEFPAAMAAATKARKMAALRSFYGYLNGIERTALNLDKLRGGVRVKSGPRHDKLMTEKEVLAVIAAAEPDPIAHALVRLLYLTGLRISEALGLRWRDCAEDIGEVLKGEATEPERAFLHVTGKGDKDRAVYVPIDLWADLRRFPGFVEDGDDLVFASIKDRHEAGRIVERLGRAAKIAKRVTPHRFRHACASHLLAKKANVADVRDLLGHASIGTTSQYAHSMGVRGLADKLKTK